MIKTLDKSFQIPKLSARLSEDKKKNDLNNVNRSTVDTKIFDMVSRNDVTKYPLAIPTGNKLYENSVDHQKLRNNINSLNTMVMGGEDGKKQNLPGSQSELILNDFF